LEFINHPVFYLKHNVSETGLCLCLQVKATHLGPNERTTDRDYIDWAQMSRHITEDRNRIQSLKWCVLNKKKRTMDTLKKLNNCRNIYCTNFYSIPESLYEHTERDQSFS
jgi:hypothetical protein